MAKRTKKTDRFAAYNRKYRSRERFRGTLTEFSVYERLLGQGWEIWPKGWPDFIAVRDGKVRLIEVKRSRSDRPTQEQREVHDVFERLLGIKVEILYPFEDD